MIPKASSLQLDCCTGHVVFKAKDPMALWAPGICRCRPAADLCAVTLAGRIPMRVEEILVSALHRRFNLCRHEEKPHKGRDNLLEKGREAAPVQATMNMALLISVSKPSAGARRF